MTVYLSSFGGVGWQFFDANGVPLSGGKIYSYEAGTTIPAPTYTDNTGSTPHANPIVLSSSGRVASGEIWQPASTNYKYVLETASSILIGTFDNVGTIVSGEATVANFTGNGSQTVFNLAFAPLSENSTNIYISGVYQQKNTYSVTGAAVTFSSAPPFGSSIEVTYF
jgi:hypothetical protein